jgi:small subunit ribosomal protein S16
MRMGKTKQPTYRVVAADSRSPRDGRFIEILGVYAPRGRSTTDADAVVEIDNDKVLRWLQQGALPTERVERLLRQSGAWEQFKPGSGAVTKAQAAGAPK